MTLIWLAVSMLVVFCAPKISTSSRDFESKIDNCRLGKSRFQFRTPFFEKHKFCELTSKILLPWFENTLSIFPPPRSFIFCWQEYWTFLAALSIVHARRLVCSKVLQPFYEILSSFGFAVSAKSTCQCWEPSRKISGNWKNSRKVSTKIISVESCAAESCHVSRASKLRVCCVNVQTNQIDSLTEPLSPLIPDNIQ